MATITLALLPPGVKSKTGGTFSPPLRVDRLPAKIALDFPMKEGIDHSQYTVSEEAASQEPTSTEAE